MVQPGAPKNPRAVGEAIVASLPENSILEGTPALAGPGFINVRPHPGCCRMTMWQSQCMAH